MPAAHLGATHPPTHPKQDDFYLTLTMTLPLFFRLKARRGYKRAVVAIAHKILVAIYHMLSQQVSYNDLGDLYLDKLNKNHLTRNLVHRLERLGYAVTLTLQQKAA